ncbi:OmpA family protein [Psychrobacter sp. JB385]|uniref:OmpA family protein n=1 Tax=Psychrobacter sp. JB385 TaxID=1434841 RepID=UPI00097F2841|nr:OmpA family protein [Psychrobacter sp. JB385]SJN32954.1 Outer membrane fibronectin-binding protein [Psychrobacter sp. JB385]
MKTQLRNTFLILVSALALSACQTSVSQNQKTDLPVAKVILDSDSDGIPDDIDECPATPENVVVDERGCPFTGMGVGLKMEYRAFFTKGSSELSKEYQLDLDKVAKKLKEYETATMRIEGHASTDEVPAVDAVLQSNALSRNRALIVKNYLIMQHQIDPNRLIIASYGAEQPIAPSDTKEGKSMNRRVYGLAQEPED